MENKACGLVCQTHIPNVLLRFLTKCSRETGVHKFQCSLFLMLPTVPWLWPQKKFLPAQLRRHDLVQAVGN